MISRLEKMVEALGLLPGQHVADFGAGAGHHIATLSKMVGKSGHVYAVDLNQELLAKIKNDSERRGEKNVDTIHGDVERHGGAKLREGVLDGVLFSNLLFQLADKEGAIDEAKRVLKKGGKLAVLEYNPAGLKSFTTEDAKSLLTSSGFSLMRTLDLSGHHWGLIFQK